ncbi:PD-(D/E)XK nuclease family protein [Engelhardtia mirabilis]|uniref:RecB family exonuclease n=1 Tax=Engelhardtia mirabilis TaxID=2528011 RepID=UPI0011A3A11C
MNDSSRIQVSASRLKTWLMCPLRWAAVYLEGKPLQMTPAMAFGRALHAALEELHRARWLGRAPEDLVAVFVDVFGAHTVLAEDVDASAPTDPARAVLKQSELEKALLHARELTAHYLDRFPDEGVEAAEIKLHSALVDPVTGEDLGADLTGVVDLITADGRVVDIKTTARASGELQTVLGHQLQIDAYRYLLQAHRPEAALAVAEIRSLIRGKLCRLEVTEIPTRGLGAFMAMVRAYLADVRSGKLLPRPSFLCSPSCPAISSCCQHHGLEVPA